MSERAGADLGLLADRRAADERSRGRNVLPPNDARAGTHTGGFRVSAADRIAIWDDQSRRLFDALGTSGFVGGGAARQLIMGEDAPPAGDIDVFCYRRQDEPLILEALMALYGPGEATAFATTFQEPDGLDVQVIRPMADGATLTCGRPADVLEHFSFTTEQFAVEADGQTWIGSSAIRDTRDRRLIVNNVTKPIDVIGRALKYAAKGYTMAPEQIHAILDDWDARPEEYRDSLRIEMRMTRKIVNGFRR